MGEMINLTSEDGFKFGAYRAAPKGKARGGLVVVHCMGGSLAWLASTRVPGIAAAIGYYGGAVAEFANEPPKSPVLLHFGETDQSIPKDHWDTIRTAQPKVPMHIYQGAGHGFSCDERASYHAASARLARERTMEFLKQHVA